MEQKNLFFELADPLVRSIYQKTLDFPSRYQSSLGDQLRRASLSIVLNIVEGGARRTVKEKRQFLNVAYASVKETKYLLYFANDCKLLEFDFYKSSLSTINRLAAIIYGYLYKRV